MSVPADICTGSYFYRRKCDNAWMVGWPGLTPDSTYQGGGAHTWIAHDSATGKDYSIGDQGVNNPNAYQRPPAEAPFALHQWENFYVAEPPICPGGYETVCAKTPPGGIQTLPAVPLAMVTDPAKKASWTVQFHCGGPVLPYYCPTDPQTRQQTAAMIYNAILWMVAHPGQAPPVPVGQQFADVPATSPFAPAINALYAAGIVAGKPAPCEKP